MKHNHGNAVICYLLLRARRKEYTQKNIPAPKWWSNTVIREGRLAEENGVGQATQGGVGALGWQARNENGLAPCSPVQLVFPRQSHFHTLTAETWSREKAVPSRLMKSPEAPFDKPGAPGSSRGVFPYSRCELRRGPENFLTFLTGDPFVFPTDLRNVKTHSEIWSQRQNPSARRVTWNNGGEKSSNCSLAERWTWGFVSKLFRLQTLSCN